MDGVVVRITGLFYNVKMDAIIVKEKRRKDEGKCIARLAHGPGHQSSTYCDVIGPHKEHNCQYGSYNQTACWTGSVYKLKFTNFFDDMG